MRSVEEAREWESKGLNREIARLTREEQAELAAEGERLNQLVGSGRCGWALVPTVEIMARYLAQLIEHRVKLRERVAREFPCLASREGIAEVRQWIETEITRKLEQLELICRAHPPPVVPKSILGAKNSLTAKAEASKTEARLALDQLVLQAGGIRTRGSLVEREDQHEESDHAVEPKDSSPLSAEALCAGGGTEFRTSVQESFARLPESSSKQAGPHGDPGAPGPERQDLVRAKMRDLGWSVEALAREAECDPRTIRTYLAAKTRLRPSTRKQIADALGLPVEDLPARFPETPGSSRQLLEAPDNS